MSKTKTKELRRRRRRRKWWWKLRRRNKQTQSFSGNLNIEMSIWRQKGNNNSPPSPKKKRNGKIIMRWNASNCTTLNCQKLQINPKKRSERIIRDEHGNAAFYLPSNWRFLIDFHRMISPNRFELSHWWMPSLISDSDGEMATWQRCPSSPNATIQPETMSNSWP